MAPSLNRDIGRRLRIPAYAFLAVTLLLQSADYFLGLLPLQVGSIVWRFAAIGSGANIVGNVLLLILLLYVASLAAGDRPMLIVVGILSVLVALCLFGGAGVFTLDALQLRARVEARAVAKFDLASGQALFKMGVEGLVGVLFAVSAFRSANALRRETLREDRPSETLLVSRAASMRAP
jgi:hypothetical protein